MSAVNISTASVPAAWCNLTLQEIWPKLVSLLAAEHPLEGYNFGPDTPGPDDQDKPWLKTDSSYVPDRWYVYSSGAWISRHPVAPGTIAIYDGLEANIPTFDGGEAGVVTATTGPMWEKYAVLDAKFPIGIGTTPNGTVIGVGTTGGTDEHTLTRAELPAVQIDTLSVLRTNVQDGGDAKVVVHEGPTGSFITDTPLPTEELGDGDPHNNMPLYAGVIFIKKTARTQYRI